MSRRYADRESLLFWTKPTVGKNYTYPEHSPLSSAALRSVRWSDLLGLVAKSRRPCALALHLLQDLLSLRPRFHEQAIGDVVLVDVADVAHRLRPNLLGGDVLHVVEPDVRIQSALGGFLAKLRDPARAGLVGSEREQGLIQLRHGLLAVVLLDHPTHVLDAGVDVRIDFGDVAHAELFAGAGHDLHHADGPHRAADGLIELGFLVALGGHQ